MKSTQYLVKVTAALAVLTLGGFTGCESSSDGLSSWSGGGYYGYGFHDPYYYGGYYDRDIVVVPPDDRPDRPSRPNGPSIPSTPRPMPRGGGGGGRR